MKDAAPELNVSSSEAEEEREENKPEGEQDPDFNQVEIKNTARFLGFCIILLSQHDGIALLLCLPLAGENNSVLNCHFNGRTAPSLCFRRDQILMVTRTLGW